MEIFLITSILIIILIIFLFILIDYNIRKYIKTILNKEKYIAISEFLTKDKNNVFPGIYLIYNETKEMYYVGQGKKVIERAQMHFKGKGNGDIYADYKHGDIFKIKIINMFETKYNSLNKLEKDTIKVYDSYYSGYNKTRGNR